MASGSYFPGRGTIIEQSYLKGFMDGFEKRFQEDWEEARAQMRTLCVLHVLDKRRIRTTASVRAHIMSCTDADTVDRWFDRVITVADVGELFADE